MVDRHKPVLIVMLVLSLACACLIPFVGVNSDMTKYLADSSSMKQGVDVMDAEFSEDMAAQYVRVMFTGMPSDQEKQTKEELEAIPYVDSVDWEADSAEYHQGDHTLFVVNTTYAYYSTEELAIEKAIEENFDRYDMVYQSGDSSGAQIPPFVIAVAVILLFAVLFIMCASFVEPFLFLIAVGCAICLNLGTNIFQGEISNMTFSIAAILQLALSIDYSVILMNRYRAELTAGGTHPEVMKRAICSTLSSVASSAFTTVVGLLALVFMSFKIGADIGIVLGKGIFFSLVCVLTMLPGLILIFDKWVEKTAKPVPHFAMRIPGLIASKGRYVFAIGFVALMAGAYYTQGLTQLAYTLDREDPISDVFPASNTLVLVYDNGDESDMARFESAFEDDTRIKSITGFSTTIGKPYTAAQMSTEIVDLAEDADTSDFNEDTLRMMYYDRFDGTQYPLAPDVFLRFLRDDVLDNDTFAKQISEDNRQDLDQLEKFSDPANLTTQKNAAQLADFLGLAEADVNDLLLGYGIENWAYTTGTLSLPAFVTFVNDQVVSDPDYGSQISQDQANQLAQLAVYANADKTTVPLDAAGAASFLGMDEASMQMIYLAYFAQKGAAAADTMTVADFATFLQADVASNPAFAQYVGQIDAAQLAQLVQYAQMMGMTDPLDAASMAQFLQMDEQSVAYLYTYNHLLHGDTSSWKISIQDLLHFMVGDSSISASLDAAQLAQLKTLSSLVDASVAGTQFTYEEMAGLLGMDGSNVYQLYLLYASRTGESSWWTASVQQLLHYLDDTVLEDASLASNFTAEDASDLRTARKLVDAVVSQQPLDAAAMASLLGSSSEDGISESEMSLLYTYYASRNHYDESWAMTFVDFANYLVNDVLNDSRYDEWMDASRRADILDMKQQIDDGMEQLVGPNYSIMMIKVNSGVGTSECNAVIADMNSWFQQNLTADYHLVGSAAMAYEMKQSFSDELLFITMLTAIAIFLVVLAAFRNFLVPLILVLIVECGVWVTVTVIGLQGYSIYYLALIIVQCILMGAAIDYGILFANNYREQRMTKDITDSLTGAYAASINTVLTSGTILVLVCAVVGQLFDNPTIGQICNTISIGAFCTIVLIVVFLPGLLATFDRLVAPKGHA